MERKELMYQSVLVVLVIFWTYECKAGLKSKRALYGIIILNVIIMTLWTGSPLPLAVICMIHGYHSVSIRIIEENKVLFKYLMFKLSNDTIVLGQVGSSVAAVLLQRLLLQGLGFFG